MHNRSAWRDAPGIPQRGNQMKLRDELDALMSRAGRHPGPGLMTWTRRLDFLETAMRKGMISGKQLEAATRYMAIGRPPESIAQIARSMGLSQTGVRMMLDRACRMIRSRVIYMERDPAYRPWQPAYPASGHLNDDAPSG